MVLDRLTCGLRQAVIQAKLTRGKTVNWQEICADPSLRDVPYKIELNDWGQIVMRPMANLRGFLCGMLVDEVNRKSRQDGVAICSCPIATGRGGVLVADLAWASDEFLGRHRDEEVVYSLAPELCVDIMSPPGVASEWVAKRGALLARGAQEVWMCDEQGILSFYDGSGQIPRSKLFPEIERIDLKILH